jgi:hypothetical protein
MLHELKAKGKSIRAIARETGRSRNTVRKYLRADGIPERKPHPKRGSKLDPYKDTIHQLMNLGIFNCEVIYERIKEEGYTGGRTILRDYVREFRPPKQLPAVCRYETDPGQQAQVDWGEYTYIDEETTLGEFDFTFQPSIDEKLIKELATMAFVLFQLVSARYEKGSIILTSNKGFGEWGELMGDPVLATAVLDRLLHHAHIINIRGNSYRLKDRVKTGLYNTPNNSA